MNNTQALPVAGATVTINPTPSAAPAPEAAQTPVAMAQAPAAKTAQITVVDSLGRNITLKRPAPLANLDFAKALGGGGQVNAYYMGEVFHLKYVHKINAEIVVMPGTEGELRALYARLGENESDGNEVCQEAVTKNFVDNINKPSEAELKNS